MYDISKEKQTPEGGQQKMAHDPCSRIQALYPRLSKVEAKIADYILRDPLRVTELSVQAMAQEIGVAQSSIVRFCRTIECSGLRELKLQLASHENAFVIPTIFEDLSPEDDAQSIATKVFTRNVNTIQAMRRCRSARYRMYVWSYILRSSCLYRRAWRRYPYWTACTYVSASGRRIG